MSGDNKDTGNDDWAGGGPVGDGDHVVKPGECAESVANANGLRQDTLWNHPKNAEIKGQRQDPHSLLPGDRLFVPPVRVQHVARATDANHPFKVKGVPSKLAIVMKSDFKALTGSPTYELEVDRKHPTGGSGSGNTLTASIMPSARKAMLEVRISKEETRRYDILIGEIDPIDEPSGLQGRLHNLGLYEGAVDGAMGPRARAALYWFQELFKDSDGLKPTGTADDTTKSVLKREHGY